MGAQTFTHTAKGTSAEEAFHRAVEEARCENGHGGYTGTIAEKDSFVTIPLPEGRKPKEYARELIDEDDERIDDKWGPAGCIKVADDEYLFFGWASS